MRRIRSFIVIAFIACASTSRAADVFLRFKVVDPPGERLRATFNGARHEDPWYLPTVTADVKGNQWSDWIDLSKWPWHGKLDRAGGIAEWPCARISVAR